MRLHVTELLSFAFCPLHHRQSGSIVPALPEPLKTLRGTVLYLYSRQLEVGYKVSWEEAQNAWNRGWWKEHQLEDRQARKESNQALIGLLQAYQYYREDRRIPVAVNFPYSLSFQEHCLLGDAPLILSDPAQPQRLSLVDIRPPTTAVALTRDLQLRAAGLMVERSLGVMPAMMEVLFFNRRFDLSRVCLYPTAQFQTDSQAIFQHLLYSIRQDFCYPNSAGCHQCQFNRTCTA